MTSIGISDIPEDRCVQHSLLWEMENFAIRLRNELNAEP